jgi:phage shock protein C
MSVSEELGKLGELHARGMLSDEEFSRAKARVLAGAESAPEDRVLSAINRLRRSRDDRWIGGVCGGLAQISGLTAWIWRLMFALLMLCAGSGGLIYLLMWILVPTEESHPAVSDRSPA